MTEAARELHAVVPAWLDDPRRPSGGSAYERRVLQELEHRGWSVTLHRLADGGGAGERDEQARALVDVLARVPSSAVMLVDGLFAAQAPAAVQAVAERRPVVVALHLPADTEAEAAALRHCAGVVVTSRWTRDHVAQHYGLAPEQVLVAEPGVDPAPSTTPRPDGSRLLAVGAVTELKGHDVLLAALAELSAPGVPRAVPAPLPWTCAVAGSLDVEPAFAERIRSAADVLGGRVTLLGALSTEALQSRFAASDLLLVPSRQETYGLVVTEALAHGIPVLASEVGGVREALGVVDGEPAGLLVEPGSPSALADALRRWLSDEDLRRELRRRAHARRPALRTWADTAADVEAGLNRWTTGSVFRTDG